MNLKETAVRGGVFTISFQAADAFLRIASVSILARMLAPEYFGLVSMVTAVTTIAERFKDFGLSTASVQQKNITTDQVSTLFWINALTGCALTVLGWFSATTIAWLFDDERLVHITMALVTGFFWSGLTAQHQALLQRRMKYTALGAIQITSTVFSTLAAIVLAIQGYGYWALVWREVLRTFVFAVGTWASYPWVPNVPSFRINVAHLVRMGRDITAFNVIVFLAASMDQILIGKAHGSRELGLYRQAFLLVFMPVRLFNDAVNRIAEPTLSFLQDDPIRYRRYYQKLLTALNFVVMPLTAFLIIYAELVVRIVLGDKWSEAAGIFRVLAIAAFIAPSSDTTGLLLVTCGKTGRYLRLGITAAIVLVTLFAIGVRWGALGVAHGFVVATYILLFVRIGWGFKETPVDARGFLGAIGRPALSSLTMMLVLALLNAWMNIDTAAILLLAATPVALAAYLLAWIVLPGGKRELEEVLRDSLAALHMDRVGGLLIARRRSARLDPSR
jgi:O-antigen/teichoic acid export membrane protein